jgi:hypothetical protein
VITVILATSVCFDWLTQSELGKVFGKSKRERWILDRILFTSLIQKIRPLVVEKYVHLGLDPLVDGGRFDGSHMKMYRTAV